MNRAKRDSQIGTSIHERFFIGFFNVFIEKSMGDKIIIILVIREYKRCHLLAAIRFKLN